MFKPPQNFTHLTCQQSNAQNSPSQTPTVNRELPDVQTGVRKGRGIRDQIANIHWITENYDQLTHHIKKQKQRHDFANKAMVFPEVMYGCENRTIKKAEC